MRLSKIISELEKIENIEIIGEKEGEISCLFADSRERVEKGLFVCLKGENADGHEKAEEGIKNGAVALLTERPLPVSVPQILVKDARSALAKTASIFYGEPSKRLKIIGVTGTNGKTTTAYMLCSILRSAGKKTGVIGTLGAVYAEKRVDTGLTTPDPIVLHRLLADMVLHGIEYVVMEVSAHALHYKKTDGILFSACIFTNLSQDHLDFFKDMQAYKQAKLPLFENERCQIAVLNGDEETGREIGALRKNGENGKTVYYGLKTPSDCFAVITDETLVGSECVLNLNDELCRVNVGMTGRHNVYNALGAAACAIELGIAAKYIMDGLNALQGVCGRLQRVGNYQKAEIYVDFAHTPDGLAQSLDTLKRFCRGRLICLFGCGGNRDKGKRRIMGERAAKKADFAVLTSDNPRFEDPLDILSEIESGFRRFSARYVIVPDRKRAIEYALNMLQRGDVLLVAGKGGENYQEIMGIKYPFNDQDIIEKTLEGKGKNPLA